MTRAQRLLEQTDTLVQDAIQEFGVTDDPFEAGYVLRDGRMLDFSGKRQGGTPGLRSYDHRDVGDMHAFLAQTGAVRCSLTRTRSLSLDIRQGLSLMQFSTLSWMVRLAEEVFIDVTDPDTGYVSTSQSFQLLTAREKGQVRSFLRTLVQK